MSAERKVEEAEQALRVVAVMNTLTRVEGIVQHEGETWKIVVTNEESVDRPGLHVTSEKLDV